MAKKYNANDIESLEYPVNIWRRPSMYLGERGGQQSVGVREIIDNSVHESVRGYASKVKVIFGEDGSINVIDDGRGLPTDINKKTGKNGIILTMATLHAGANFSSNVQAGKAGAGLNGVGASATNALSKRFDVKVYRDDREYRLSFQNGFAGHFSGDSPDDEFVESDKVKSKKDPRSAEEKKAFPTGTNIKFWYNEDRFPSNETVDIDDLVNRLKYTVYMVPDLHIDIEDHNRTYEDGSIYTWNFHSTDGIREMVEVIAPDQPLPDTSSKEDLFQEKGIYEITTEGYYVETTTDAEGKPTEVKRTVTADVAFRYGTGYEKTLKSFVNTIQTHLGGIHEKALEKAFVKGFGSRLSSMRGVLSAKDETPIADDYFEGLTIVLSVNVPEPQFVGQQKDKLSGPEVEKALTACLTEALEKFANNTKNQDILRPMFTKVVQAANNRKAATEERIAKRKSNKVSSSAVPSKLSDCDLTGTEESELLICEGDSAKGTIVQARDATYQAAIPIRGKILNSYLADNNKIINNKEIMDIAKAIGAGFGKSFDIDKIRYGKIIFAADADDDGLQINNLLFTVFYRMFRPLLEEGRVYQAVPPLFEVTVGSGRNQEVIYVASNADLPKVVQQLEAKGKTFKVDRNKGLGEMDPEAFYDTVLDPEKRTLKRITIEDIEKTEGALKLTMGESSQEKKDYIGDNFQVAIDSGLVDGYEEASE